MNRFFWVLMIAIGAGVDPAHLNDSAGSTFGIENYDFSRLIWLGALVALIGAGLLRSGRPLGRWPAAWAPGPSSCSH